MNLEAKLANNRFAVDEENPHIAVAPGTTAAAAELLVRGCPAGLYRPNADGGIDFDYAGCLECGTCYILANGRAVASWDFPRGDMGVEYRRG